MFSIAEISKTFITVGMAHRAATPNSRFNYDHT